MRDGCVYGISIIVPRTHNIAEPDSGLALSLRSGFTQNLHKLAHPLLAFITIFGRLRHSILNYFKSSRVGTRTGVKMGMLSALWPQGTRPVNPCQKHCTASLIVATVIILLDL